MARQGSKHRLSPLDLVMPGTYVQACLTFETSEPSSAILPILQQSLDEVVSRLPWLAGRVVSVPEAPGQRPSLEMRWDGSDSAPVLQDKGTIEPDYAVLAARGMPPKDIPPSVSPLGSASPNPAAPPVFAASIFGFPENKAVGLCVCVHHNAVDATGFADIMGLWSRATSGLPLPSGSESEPQQTDRPDRLAEALGSELATANAQSLEKLWASHPEYSRVPPAFPSEFPRSTCEYFRIPMARIDALKKKVEAQTSIAPTTTTLATALMWQAVTRARAARDPDFGQSSSRLVTAVNGRGRVGPGFSTSKDPWMGNAVLYALTEQTVSHMRVGDGSLAETCAAISEAQSASRINRRFVAEVCSLFSRVDDHRQIFAGWDLFSSRDMTITSWNGLELYGLDFGQQLGKVQHVRPPYVEADGVGFVLPRKGGATAEEDAVEVIVMLRRDDMAFVVEDEVWSDLVVKFQE